MTNDWQTWTALGIVAITAVLYVRYLLRKRARSSRTGGDSCGSDCGCGKKKS